MEREELLERIMKGLPQGDLTTLQAVLRQLEGTAFDEETRVWLESDFSRLGDYKSYDWGDVDPETIGKPVVISSSGDLTVEDD